MRDEVLIEPLIDPVTVLVADLPGHILVRGTYFVSRMRDCRQHVRPWGDLTCRRVIYGGIHVQIDFHDLFWPMLRVPSH